MFVLLRVKDVRSILGARHVIFVFGSVTLQCVVKKDEELGGVEERARVV